MTTLKQHNENVRKDIPERALLNGRGEAHLIRFVGQPPVSLCGIKLKAGEKWTLMEDGDLGQSCPECIDQPAERKFTRSIKPADPIKSMTLDKRQAAGSITA